MTTSKFSTGQSECCKLTKSKSVLVKVNVVLIYRMWLLCGWFASCWGKYFVEMAIPQYCTQICCTSGCFFDGWIFGGMIWMLLLVSWWQFLIFLFQCCNCFVGGEASFFFSFFFFVGECVRVSLRLLHRISVCVPVVSLFMVLLLFLCLVWGVASGC